MKTKIINEIYSEINETENAIGQQMSDEEREILAQQIINQHDCSNAMEQSIMCEIFA